MHFFRTTFCYNHDSSKEIQPLSDKKDLKLASSVLTSIFYYCSSYASYATTLFTLKSPKTFILVSRHLGQTNLSRLNFVRLLTFTWSYFNAISILYSVFRFMKLPQHIKKYCIKTNFALGCTVVDVPAAGLLKIFF